MEGRTGTAARRPVRRLAIATLTGWSMAVAAATGPAGAAGPEESFRGGGFELEYQDRFLRSLAIWKDGSGGEPTLLARYPLPECGIRSSKTGAFAFLEEVDPAPYAVVICEELSNARSLFVFAPSENAAAPIFAVTGKRELGVMLTMGGLIAGWREGPGYETAIWEARDNRVVPHRFADARDRLLFGQPVTADRAAEGLPAEDHLLPLRPDEPLRLGPSVQAPFFDRLWAEPLIHLAPAAAEAQPFWRAGDWLRVCVPDGPCGYVPGDALVPVSAAR